MQAKTEGNPPQVGSSEQNNVDTSDLEKKQAEPQICCISLRVFALFLLVFQNAGTALVMRLSLIRGSQYSIASAVITTEFVKFVICLGAMIVEYYQTKPPESLRGFVISQVFVADGWRLAIPATLYTVQNNLLFVALANLEATLFQVTYQMKIFTTAILMVIMLGKSFSYRKWLSLVMLFLGIVLTQIKPGAPNKAKANENLFKGLAAVVTCAFCSGFASVYFEKMLKGSGGQSASLAVRNIQLSFFSTILTFVVYSAVEGRSLNEFFMGYGVHVATVVGFQAAGGLLVALVIKYADNILKGFATAVAIVVSGIGSFLFLDFEPTTLFLAGAFCVIFAVCMYSWVS